MTHLSDEAVNEDPAQDVIVCGSSHDFKPVEKKKKIDTLNTLAGKLTVGTLVHVYGWQSVIWLGLID